MRARVAVSLLAACAASIAAAGSAQGGSTERVSVGPRGRPAVGGESAVGSVSADGRFVAFASFATNLVPGDTNGLFDVFVRDRASGRTERVSVRSGGAQAKNGRNGSHDPFISADGRYVAFYSDVSDLVPDDTNDADDVFVHDRATGRTERVSVGPGGAEARGRGFGSYNASVSARGRFVAFDSAATNLVRGDTNGADDVFLRDRKTSRTERVSVGPGGVQADAGSGGASVSGNGRFVAFTSRATNLVPGDTNGVADVFVRDRERGTTERVNIGTAGAQADAGTYGSPSISADGRLVAFTSRAANLVAGDTNGREDVFLRDRERGTTELVSVGPGGTRGDLDSYAPSVSADGRVVAFVSRATNLVAGDTNGALDTFVRDRAGGTTERASVGSGGAEADRSSLGRPDVSADGRHVAFAAQASNLVPGDSNDAGDVFLRSR